MRNIDTEGKREYEAFKKKKRGEISSLIKAGLFKEGLNKMVKDLPVMSQIFLSRLALIEEIEDDEYDQSPRSYYNEKRLLETDILRTLESIIYFS